MRLTTFALLTAPLLVSAQFGSFFDNMFNGGGHDGHHHQHRRQNVPSDPRWYRENYEGAACDKYLCPGTLACVDTPTHCPCAFDSVEDKVELDKEGLSICMSKRPKGAPRAELVDAMRKGYL